MRRVGGGVVVSKSALYPELRNVMNQDIPHFSHFRCSLN